MQELYFESLQKILIGIRRVFNDNYIKVLWWFFPKIQQREFWFVKVLNNESNFKFSEFFRAAVFPLFPKKWILFVEHLKMFSR